MIHRSLAFAFLASTAVTLAPAARAADDFIVTIRSAKGLCLDVRSESQDPGASIILYRCHGSDNQRWSLTAQGRDDGWFRAQSVNSHQCLDVKGESTAAGARLIQWPCKRDDVDNQRFDFVPATRNGRTGEIRPRHSNLCLDAGDDRSHVKVRQQKCNGSAQQQWAILR